MAINWNGSGKEVWERDVELNHLRGKPPIPRK